MQSIVPPTGSHECGLQGTTQFITNPDLWKSISFISFYVDRHYYYCSRVETTTVPDLLNSWQYSKKGAQMDRQTDGDEDTTWWWEVTSTCSLQSNVYKQT